MGLIFNAIYNGELNKLNYEQNIRELNIAKKVMLEQVVRNDKDVILDGFPRTIGQAQWIVKSYANVFDIKVIFLAITEEKMIARIKKRLQSGEHRADDANENAVKKRIESFKNIR